MPGVKHRLSVDLEQVDLLPVMSSKTGVAMTALRKALELAHDHDMIDSARFTDAMTNLNQMDATADFSNRLEASRYYRATELLRRAFPREY